MFEVADFLNETEEILILNMDEYHNNIQSFGLRKTILDHYPKLIVLDNVSKLIIIKTNVDDVLKKNKINVKKLK